MVSEKKEVLLKEEEMPKIFEAIKKEVGKLIIGHEENIRSLVLAVLCGGHVLLSGVPGVAKTSIIESLAKVLGCSSRRIWFNEDMSRADLIGIVKFNEKEKDFELIKGPIFTNILVAEGINHSSPETQSVLLEAMQEEKVSIPNLEYNLPKPFFVMATEDSLEHQGIHSLSQIHLDRFLFKLIVSYPENEDEEKILELNTSVKKFKDFGLKSILNPEKIIRLQKKVSNVYSSPEIRNYIVRLVDETRKKDTALSKYISVGCSPRASIALYIVSKAEALLKGRNYVLPEDVKAVAPPVMRHRLILSFEAENEKVSSDKVIKELFKNVGAP